MLDQIAFDVSSSVVLVVIIKYMSVSEPSGLSDTELSTCHAAMKLDKLEDHKRLKRTASSRTYASYSKTSH
jgi:hypothetical protein